MAKRGGEPASEVVEGVFHAFAGGGAFGDEDGSVGPQSGGRVAGMIEEADLGAGLAVCGRAQDDGGDQLATGGEVGGEPHGDGGRSGRAKIEGIEAVPSGRCPNEEGSIPHASFNGGAFKVLPGRARRAPPREESCRYKIASG